MLQFEEALLAENYENIEKYSKKMRKKREVSEGKLLFGVCVLLSILTHFLSPDKPLTRLWASTV